MFFRGRAILPLWNRICLSYVCLTIVFSNHITLISKAYSYRGIYSRKSYDLSLILLRLRWNFLLLNWCPNELRIWGLLGCNKSTLQYKEDIKLEARSLILWFPSLFLCFELNAKWNREDGCWLGVLCCHRWVSMGDISQGFITATRISTYTHVVANIIWGFLTHSRSFIFK